MKVNFDSVITTLDGKDFQEGGSPITLRKLAVQALVGIYPDEQSLGGEEKFNRYTLALKVRDANGETIFSPEEVAKVKLLIGKGFYPEAVGAAYTILNAS